jgi:hypothetical protein
MPRLLPIESPNPVPALLALRRTLWQLAMLGVASAIAIGMLAETPGVLPAWLLLTPIAALFVHHRETLLALVRAAAHVDWRTDNPRRRPLRRRANQRIEPMSRRRLSRQPLPAKQVR